MDFLLDFFGFLPDIFGFLPEKGDEYEARGGNIMWGVRVELGVVAVKVLMKEQTSN